MGVAMKDQHTISSGLLYSVEPLDLATLHLREGDELDWGAENSGGSILTTIISFLRKVYPSRIF